MIKDKLHTITDEQAIEVARLLLITSTSDLYVFKFDSIRRNKYDNQDGVDAEESVNIYFTAMVKSDMYRTSGWKDEKIMISLIEKDRYHNHPYFNGNYKIDELDQTSNVWKHKYLSNHIEAIEYLQKLMLV